MLALHCDKMLGINRKRGLFLLILAMDRQKPCWKGRVEEVAHLAARKQGEFPKVA